MELMEAVSVVIAKAAADDLCPGEEEYAYKGGKCRMAKHGEDTNVSAEQLNKNMQGLEFLPEDPLPKIKLGEKEWWDLDKCNAGTFPYQSHHLIPKMHLPKHAVCQFLAKNAGKKKWKLKQSTDYDTDSNRNGLALPFASNTYQYKTGNYNNLKGEAAKLLICNTMMQATTRQLHQGSHTDTDYLEEVGLHSKEKTGYLGRVDTLLNLVNEEALEHYEDCKPCKHAKSNPQEIRPLERVVEAVYEVSAVIATMIADRNIFVSKKAALFVKSGGLGGLP